ncbi:MAG: CBS domain-containing protein [Planctomycetaceae bacterium]
MICPDCSHDNITGVDLCEACGQPLAEFDPAGSDLEQSISRHTVRVLVPKRPVTVDSSTPVRECIREMADRGFGCLLVEEDGKLAGVFTERDVLDRISGDLDLAEAPVAEFMTRDPVTISRNDSIAYALHQMDLGGYRHMPIVDAEGRPNGIISVRDILRFLCVRFAALRDDD